MERKLIAIIRGIGSDRMLESVGALVDGGISLLEVTLDQTDETKTNDGIYSMERIKKSFGDRVCLGAGTVISVNQVKRVVAAGVLGIDYIKAVLAPLESYSGFIRGRYDFKQYQGIHQIRS